MLLKFQTAEERRTYGGSTFIEIQYCNLPIGTSSKKILSLTAITNWERTSLYVEDVAGFFAEYKEMLGKGLYNNMEESIVDVFGINYFNAEKTNNIIHKLKMHKPKRFEIFLEWLMDNPNQNGFYILGI